MKKIVWSLLLIVALSVRANEEIAQYNVHLEPIWTNLDPKGEYEKQFGNKWMLVGSMTFKKRVNEPLKVERLTLQWKGDKIDHLCGSLYRKLPEKEFLAIEDNLICDSAWNQADQALIFEFQNNRQSVGSLTIFYLVLSISPIVEPQLQSGHFSLSHLGLPAPLQEYTKTHAVDLALGKQKKTTSVS